MAAEPAADGLALTFSVGGEQLALDAGQVAEVMRTPTLRRVPLAPPGLAGVANLRGAVIPIVSLAGLLGRPDTDETGGRVIVTGGEAPVGLIVDRVASLVPSGRIRSGEEPARYLPLERLLDQAFGSLQRKGRSIAAAVPAAKAAEAVAGERSFLGFEIARQEFGLPLDSVQEVIAMPAELARIPDSDSAMLGLVSLRNRLLPLLSLSVLLGFGSARPGAGARVVIAAAGGIRLGLVVDRVSAIFRAGEAEIDPVPPVLVRGRQEARIQSVCRLEGGRRLVSILSTDHLLEEGLLERLAAQEEEEEVNESASGATEQFVVFELGEESYGLPIGSVQEVIAAPDRLTRLPKAPDFVEGVISVRGRVIPVIDQRRRFASGGGGGARRGRIIVVRIGEAEAGFLVDGVSHVLRVPLEQLRDTPGIAAGDSRVIDRIANLEIEGRMYLLVDPRELLDRAEQDMLAGLRGDVSAPS